jgi:hypothetical protein
MHAALGKAPSIWVSLSKEQSPSALVVAIQRRGQSGPIQQSARRQQGNKAKELIVADNDLVFIPLGHDGSPFAGAMEEGWPQRHCLSV